MNTIETSQAAAETEAETIGKVFLPILVVFLFAGYHLLLDGTPISLEIIILFAASILSVITIRAYRSLSRQPQMASWRRAAIAYSGLLPYAFAVYLIVALGVLPIFHLWSAGFSIWTLLGGCFWLLIGWRILFGFWLITERVNKEVHAL